MTENKKPRMPRGLDAPGKKFWIRTLEEFDLSQDPHRVEVLEQACRVVDTIAELEKAQKGQSLTTSGSMGQQVISPLISEVRFQRGLLAQLVTKLSLPETDETLQAKAEKTSQSRRTSAKQATFTVVR
ncbi:hypothetical protein [Rhodococcus sp. T7]|uniref:hypothetical protein n=1 Tax=Rhodococcus sp. T7 TaxID=627444 RepID=UPI0013CB0BFD|nr:hypothetical protein [Rhodococcus sp. T7]KAF0959795.1 hypothetical protein MLGJGCBP_07131 [Rhodococcus sp. T7]